MPDASHSSLVSSVSSENTGVSSAGTSGAVGSVFSVEASGAVGSVFSVEVSGAVGSVFSAGVSGSVCSMVTGGSSAVGSCSALSCSVTETASGVSASATALGSVSISPSANAEILLDNTITMQSMAASILFFLLLFMALSSIHILSVLFLHTFLCVTFLLIGLV
nr:hypothetical protein [uncultured Blautia sp.]